MGRTDNIAYSLDVVKNIKIHVRSTRPDKTKVLDLPTNLNIYKGKL